MRLGRRHHIFVFLIVFLSFHSVSRSQDLGIQFEKGAVSVASINKVGSLASNGSNTLPSLAIATPITISAGPNAPNEYEARSGGQTAYTAEQIGQIAWRQSTLAQLMCREANAVSLLATQHHRTSNTIAAEYLQMNASRLAQQSAEQAMLLHYAIAAILKGLPLIRQSLEGIDRAIEQQQLAIENGIPVADPTRLAMHRIDALDRKASNELLLSKLRIQMTLLIPHEIACQYQPIESADRLKIPADLCREIQCAYTRRCDLLALRNLGRKLTVEDLEFARLVGGQLTGKSLAVGAKVGLMKTVFRFNKEKDEKELALRKQQIEEAATSLEHQIANQIEIDLLELQTTTERHRLAEQQVELHRMRVEQLKSMATLGRPMPTELLKSQAEQILAMGAVIERFNDLNQAEVRWLSATGLLNP